VPNRNTFLRSPLDRLVDEWGRDGGLPPLPELTQPNARAQALPNLRAQALPSLEELQQQLDSVAPGRFKVVTGEELSEPQKKTEAPQPESTPKPEEIERTWGEALKDAAVMFGQGSGALVKMLGDLGGLITGKMDNPVSRYGKFVIDWYGERKSDALKAKERERAKRIAKADGEVDKGLAFLRETFSDPALATAFFIEQVPLLAATGGAGLVAGAGARAVGAGVATRAAVGTGTAVGAGSALQGADSGGDSYERLVAIPTAEERRKALAEIAGGQQSSLDERDLWAANEAFARLVEAGVPPEEARKEVALELSRWSAIKTAALSLGIQVALPGARSIERVLAGGARGTATGGARGAARGAVRGTVGEGFSEATEEGYAQFAANQAVQAIDPEQDLFEGVGEATASGLAFAPLGGVSGAFEGYRRQEVQNGAAQDGAGSSPLDQFEADMAGGAEVAVPSDDTILQPGQPAVWRSNGQEIPLEVISVNERAPGDDRPHARVRMGENETLVPMEELAPAVEPAPSGPVGRAVQNAMRQAEAAVAEAEAPVEITGSQYATDGLPVRDVGLPGVEAVAPVGLADAGAVAATPGVDAVGRAVPAASGERSGIDLPSTDVAADAQPALSPGLVLRGDGTPFKTEKTARQAMKNRRLQGYEPVAVEGGFALAPVVAQEAQAAGSEAAPQPGEASDQQEIRRGEVGVKLSAGERVLTASGRVTTPFPKIDTSNNRKASNTLKRVDQWLMDNAIAEARSRGDEFNARQFEASRERPSQADKDSAEEYLFGEQPAVVRSPLKPMSKVPAAASPAAAPTGSVSEPAGQKATPSKRQTAKQKADAARQRARDMLGAKEGDVVTPSADIGYSRAGESYRVISIGADGSVDVENVATGSRTQWSRSDLAAATRRGVEFARQEAATGAEDAPAAEQAGQESASSKPPAKQGAEPEQPKQEKASEPHPLVGKTVRFVAWGKEKTGVVTGVSDGTVIVRGQGGLYNVGIDRVEVIGEAEARSDKAELTPDDLDRIPFPLDAGYRIVSRPGENAVVIAPRKVGALYTDDDFKKLAAYGKPFGFSVIRHGEKRGYAYIIGPLTRPDDWIGAFLSDGGVAEAARKQREQEEAEAKRKKEAQKEEEYRNLPSSKWIDENLGTEFTNLTRIWAPNLPIFTTA